MSLVCPRKIQTQTSIKQRSAYKTNIYIYIHLPHHTLSTYSLSVNLEVWLIQTLLVNVINSTLFKVRVTVISLMESTATANVSLLIYELFRMSIHKYTILYYIKGALFTILMR